MSVFFIFFILTTVSVCQICPHSHFFNGQRCAPCLTNCICSVQNTCKTCLSGYTFDSNFQNCIQCPLQTSITNRGCLECCSQIIQTSFVCSKCQTGLGNFLIGGQCLGIDGCLTIDQNGKCQSCGEGYYIQNGICGLCDASCRNCLHDSFCVSCQIGYFNSSNSNYGLCSSCPLGCSTCTSATVCTGCLEKYRLASTTCVACGGVCLQCSATGCIRCQTGYDIISGVCTACTTTSSGGSTGCLTCTSSPGGTSLKCLSCQTGYYLSASSTCIACTSTFPNSRICTSTTVLQCLNDLSSTLSSRYYLYNNQCVLNTKNCKAINNINGNCSTCYFGDGLFYTLTSGQCNKCVQNGCSLFSTNCTCLGCGNGFQFVNSQCVACQNLNCRNCQATIRSCQKCNDYYGLVSTACVKCSSSVCINCDNDINYCSKCIDNYYLNLGKCYKCQSSCITCTSSILCTQCNVGYSLFLGRCKILPSQCLEVDGQGSCLKCEFGFMRMNGICVACSSSLVNMAQCQKYCPSYYALLSSQPQLFYWKNALIILIIFIFLQIQ